MTEDRGTVKTYSLDEVAAIMLPPNLKQPRLWLMRRLRRGHLIGYRAGREWRMTEGQLHDNIERLTNAGREAAPQELPPPAEPVNSVVAGLSARSKARRNYQEASR
jgi:hypothetical protein